MHACIRTGGSQGPRSILGIGGAYASAEGQMEPSGCLGACPRENIEFYACEMATNSSKFNPDREIV